jgi:hypothetical protein
MGIVTVKRSMPLVSVMKEAKAASARFILLT